MDSSITDLLAEGGFRSGLISGGLVSLGIALGVRGDARGQPALGVAFGGAAVAALAQQSLATSGFILGVVALAGAGVLTTCQGPMTCAVGAVPGVVLVALSAGLDRSGWAVPTILAVSLVGGGWRVADFDRDVGTIGLVPALLAISLLGAWATTPDTEHVATLAGAALPLVALGWPRPRASLGRGGAVLVTAIVAWAVVVDGAPRPGAVVGGLACLGLLVLAPAVRRAVTWRPLTPPSAWRGRLAALVRHVPMRPRGPVGRHPAALIVLHVGVVLGSRLAGLRSSAAAALAIVAITYALAAAALLRLQAPRPPEDG